MRYWLRAALLVLATLTLTKVGVAQERVREFAAFVPVAGSANQITPAVWVPATVPSTHWQTGLLIGGAGGFLLGAVLASRACDGQGCAGSSLGVGAVLGLAGAAVGALIGGQIPRAPTED